MALGFAALHYFMPASHAKYFSQKQHFSLDKTVFLCYNIDNRTTDLLFDKRICFAVLLWREYYNGKIGRQDFSNAFAECG
jgi:hypothetical protein